jgi:hypothetical protein
LPNHIIVFTNAYGKYIAIKTIEWNLEKLKVQKIIERIEIKKMVTGK